MDKFFKKKSNDLVIKETPQEKARRISIEEINKERRLSPKKNTISDEDRIDQYVKKALYDPTSRGFYLEREKGFIKDQKGSRRKPRKTKQSKTKAKTKTKKTKPKTNKKGGGLKSSIKRKLGIIPGKGEILAFDKKGRLRYYDSKTFNH